MAPMTIPKVMPAAIKGLVIVIAANVQIFDHWENLIVLRKVYRKDTIQSQQLEKILSQVELKPPTAISQRDTAQNNDYC